VAVLGVAQGTPGERQEDALEIDAIALRALETMPDVVAAVKLDRSLKPQ
jgi:hypothetical protein